MSFLNRVAQSDVVAGIDARADRATVVHGGQPVAATPVGVAVGSALVAAAWTGAQVGDVAD